MKLDEIKMIAQQHGLKAGKLKKDDLIRAIQSAEAYDACFNLGKSGACGQDDCLWRSDCK